jgi:hypothetical protein
MKKIRLETGMSPTRGVYWMLKPYWRMGILDDQHWAYIITCLRRIERRCEKCKEEMIIKAI